MPIACETPDQLQGVDMVRIAKVEPLTVSYPEPNDDNATRMLTLCRIETDDGLVGWGEAVTTWPAVSRATEALIEGFAELLIGADVRGNVELWRSMRSHSWWYGHGGGLSSFAIAAIDIALWDLKGKATGLSLVDLLGGASRERLPVIASTHAFRSSIAEEADVHGRYVADGYQGVKIGFGKRGEARLGYDIERDITFVRAVRESIGPEADLMIDRGQSLPWDLERAVTFTQAIEDQRLRWMEEPFEPHEIENFKAYRARVGTMVGTAEREWDDIGYERVIRSGIVDVVGCDPGRAQGITGSAKVIDLVERAGLWFNAHTWSSAIVTAASIALSATTDRCLLVELKPMENPMQHELVAEPFAHDDGWIAPPTSPGLGIDVDESVVERYRVRW